MMIRRKKRFGQHFLSSAKMLDLEAVFIDCAGKHVLEIGGGDGRLSERLAPAAAQLYIVEKDARFASFLHKKFRNCRNVKVIEEDFLALIPFNIDIIAGNMPYYISSAITFRLLDWKFERAVLMYQKEFAEKMLAKGNKRSRLSFFSQYYFSIKPLLKIPNTAFSPKPKVDSILLELAPKKTAKLNEKVSKAITSLFQYRSKSLRSTFKVISKMRHAGRIDADKLCEGIDCSKRVFELDENEIIKIGKKLSSFLPAS